MTKRDYFVIGAGGHGKVVLATLLEAGIQPLGLFDDDPAKQGINILGVPVIGMLNEVMGYLEQGIFILGIGDNRIRKKIAASLPSAIWGSVIHPYSFVHPSVKAGPGVVVMAGAVVQPDTILESHSIVNTGAIIDHDGRVGAFAHVAPGASLAGGVSIGEGVLIGIGSSVVPGVKIGPGAVVGAGAVVVDDVPSGVTVVGVPARPKDGME